MARRAWLDWTEPALPAAASRLIRSARDDAPSPTGPCDLRQLLCVVPGRRAGRLLLTVLAEQCRDVGSALIPPDIRTPAGLVDAVVTAASRPTATAAEQALAWVEALRTSDPATIAPLVGPRAQPREVLDWHDLSLTLLRIARELAGERLTPADVADRAERMELLGEADRWRAFDRVHGAYRAALAEAGLADPEAARWEALDGGVTTGDRRLVLVGVVELNAMQRAAVEAWGERAEAFIHAPRALEDRFDELGCLRADAWADAPLDIEDERIVVADRPADQAQAVLRALAEFGGAHPAEEITVGLGDEALEDLVARAGRAAGVSLHWAAGAPLARTAPCRLLAAMAEWLAEGRLAGLGALLRHPHVEASLARRLPEPAGTAEAGLGLLDAYVEEHLQDDCRNGWLGEPRPREQIEAIHGAIETLCGPLRAERDLPLGEWAARIVQALGELYGSIDDDPDVAGDAALADACGAINDVCAELARAAPELQPRLDAPAAIEIVVARARDKALPQDPRRGDVEMLGWLELHLDLAPAVVVAGFNDGNVPETVASDGFLPDALRRSLGLASNNKRYARDAYFLEALRHRCRELRLVAGHRSAEGETLAPSRLLLAAPRERLPERVLRLCGDDGAVSFPWPMGAPETGAVTAFEVPALPDDLEPPASMSVTEFGAYLRCPYRYALRRLLGLEPVRHEAAEMDARTFGGLAHEVLLAFATDADVAGSTDPQRISDFLVAALAARSEARFGRDPLPAVRVQIASLARRLHAFARFQAGHRRRGWVIQHAEIAYRDTPLDVPGQEPMPIRGRIDRIDRNETTGAWLIADYKTSEGGGSPHVVHHGRATLPRSGEPEWKELQLPLYRYLAERNGVSGEVALGYIVLPRRAEGSDLLVAGWTDAHLEAAIERARAVVRDIRALEFPLNEDYPFRTDDLARICQTNAFGAEPAEEDES